ncbi:hypothetical protein ACJX0J_015949 [Zea mays]
MKIYKNGKCSVFMHNLLKNQTVIKEIRNYLSIPNYPKNFFIEVEGFHLVWKIMDVWMVAENTDSSF